MLESHHDEDIVAAAAKLAEAQLYADEIAAGHQVLFCALCDSRADNCSIASQWKPLHQLSCCLADTLGMSSRRRSKGWSWSCNSRRFGCHLQLRLLKLRLQTLLYPAMLFSGCGLRSNTPGALHLESWPTSIANQAQAAYLLPLPKRTPLQWYTLGGNMSSVHCSSHASNANRVLQPAICRDAVQAARDAAAEAGTTAQQREAAAQATLSAALHAAAAVSPGRGSASGVSRSSPSQSSSATAEKQLPAKPEAASAALAAFDVSITQPQAETSDAAEDLAQQQESNARLRSGLAEALRKLSAMTPRSTWLRGPGQFDTAPAASRLPSSTAAAPTAEITAVVGRLEDRFASTQGSPHSTDPLRCHWSGTKLISSGPQVCRQGRPPSSLCHICRCHMRNDDHAAENEIVCVTSSTHQMQSETLLQKILVDLQFQEGGIDQAESASIFGSDLEAAAFPILTPDQSEVQSGHSDRFELKATAGLPPPLSLRPPATPQHPGHCPQWKLAYCIPIRIPRYFMTPLYLQVSARKSIFVLKTKIQKLLSDMILCIQVHSLISISGYAMSEYFYKRMAFWTMDLFSRTNGSSNVYSLVNKRIEFGLSRPPCYTLSELGR